MNFKKTFKSLDKKRKVCFWIFTSLTAFIIWFIYSHSAKPAVESSMDSEGLSHYTAVIINYLFGTSLTSEHTVFYVRTFAHFAEFAALAFSFSSTLESLKVKKQKNFFSSFIFTALIASSDETLQLFYDGRAFQISDIFIDLSGGIIGIIFSYLILKLFLREKQNG